MAPSKLFKVMYKAKKIAIVAASFDEFLDKSSKKLDLSAEVEIGVHSADGFKIDEESFMLLKEETVLIISVRTENEMKLLQQNFDELESPVYFRSAIEILEKAYIHNDDVRESLTRYARWEKILKMRSDSVHTLVDAINEKGDRLTVENFPQYVCLAYKFCNGPIHTYFLKKNQLSNNSLQCVYNSNNLHFGQGLTKLAVELIFECLKTEGSPTKIRKRSPYRSRHSRFRSRHSK